MINPAWVTALFPLLAVALSAVALRWPMPFVALKGAIVPLLGIVMLGMGLTLTFSQLRSALTNWRAVAVGVAAQFLLMPLLAWAICTGLALPLPLAAGLILVGCCPGGTASNVICYLARGNVALSVVLTSVSTLLAVLLTPLLTLLYIGQRVPVPVLDMLLSIVRIVLLPVLLGTAINTLFGSRLTRLHAIYPLLSVAIIVLIVAIIVALNSASLAALAASTVIAVVLHNGLGLATGYGLARAVCRDAQTARTIAIEVGMQNSGLGVALAIQFFSSAAAVPGALFSIWHNLSGAALAAFWRRSPPQAQEPAS